jgi:hypothetical protein
MNLIQLFQVIGIDNIGYQNFANCCTGGSANRKGDQITYKFVTDQPIYDVLMAKTKTGLVVWVDTDKVEAAMKSKEPTTYTVTFHDKFIHEYEGDVFVVFDPTDDGSSIMGACRTLEEAQALLNKAATGEGAANGFM